MSCELAAACFRKRERREREGEMRHEREMKRRDEAELVNISATFSPSNKVGPHFGQPHESILTALCWASTQNPSIKAVIFEALLSVC